MFKRLFWPTVHNQYDVDLLGRQGFWIAAAVGILSFVILTIGGHVIVGMATALVYLAGACGIRERSIAASTLIFILYFFNFAITQFVTLRAGGFSNPILGLVILMLLAANVRATFQSRNWMSGEDTELPERSTESFGDVVANGLPVKIWKITKYPFFVLAALLLLLTMMGSAMLLINPIPTPKEQSREANSLSIEVAPPAH
ncbi:MAG: hypothetical protein JSS87_14450 [Acidobacteria bacterium]|nr:hypothetical protein [Acidobacteriota bacterium]